MAAEEVTFREGHAYLASQAGFFPNGERLFTSAADGTVRIWSTETARKFSGSKEPATAQRLRCHATVVGSSREVRNRFRSPSMTENKSRGTRQICGTQDPGNWCTRSRGTRSRLLPLPFLPMAIWYSVAMTMVSAIYGSAVAVVILDGLSSTSAQFPRLHLRPTTNVSSPPAWTERFARGISLIPPMYGQCTDDCFVTPKE